MNEKEFEKVEKYQNLTLEIRRVWSVKKRGCSTGLGSVTKKLAQWIEKLGIRLRIRLLQKSTL